MIGPIGATGATKTLKPADPGIAPKGAPAPGAAEASIKTAVGKYISPSGGGPTAGGAPTSVAPVQATYRAPGGIGPAPAGETTSMADCRAKEGGPGLLTGIG